MILTYAEEIVLELRQKLITDLEVVSGLMKDKRDPELLKYIQAGIPVLQAALEAAEATARQQSEHTP